MANYYSYFDNSTAGQNTRSEIKAESATFGMDVSQDINCGIITSINVTIGSTGGVSGSGREYEGGIGFGTIGDSDWSHAKFQLPQYAGIASAPLEAGSLFYNTSTGDICYYNEAASRFEKITSTAA